MLAVGAGWLTTVLVLTIVLVHALARQLSPQVIASLAPGRSRSPTCTPSGTVRSATRGGGALRRGHGRVPAASRRLGDEFFGWLAIAAVLAAASHVNYLLYPAINSQWLYAGDLFRFAFYAVLLVGSMREIWSYWHALSRAAVLEERQRIACDLHDGVAQELAYLARNLDTLSGAADEELPDPVAPRRGARATGIPPGHHRHGGAQRPALRGRAGRSRDRGRGTLPHGTGSGPHLRHPGCRPRAGRHSCG